MDLQPTTKAAAVAAAFRSGRPALLLAASLLALPAAAQHLVRGERFEMVFPREPLAEERAQDTKLGPLLTRSWTLDQGRDTWVLAVTEYPSPVVRHFGAAALLGMARDQAVAAVNSTLERDQPVELEPWAPLAPFPGVEFRARSPVGATLSARVFLVENRVFQLVRIRWGDFDDDAFEAFAEAFRVFPPWWRPPPAERFVR